MSSEDNHELLVKELLYLLQRTNCSDFEMCRRCGDVGEGPFLQSEPQEIIELLKNHNITIHPDDHFVRCSTKCDENKCPVYCVDCADEEFYKGVELKYFETCKQVYRVCEDCANSGCIFGDEWRINLKMWDGTWNCGTPSEDCEYGINVMSITYKMYDPEKNK